MLKVSSSPGPEKPCQDTNLLNVCSAFLSSTSRLLSIDITLLLTCPLCNDTTSLLNIRFPFAIRASGSDQKCFPSARSAGNPLDSILNALRDLPAEFPAPCLHPACSVQDKEWREHTKTCTNCIIASSPPAFSFLLLTSTSPQTCLCLSEEILNMQSTAQAEIRGKPSPGSSRQAAVTKLSPTEWHCLCQAGLCVLSWTVTEMDS